MQDKTETFLLDWVATQTFVSRDQIKLSCHRKRIETCETFLFQGEDVRWLKIIFFKPSFFNFTNLVLGFLYCYNMICI